MIMCFLASFFTALVAYSRLTAIVRIGLLLTAIASVGMYGVFRMFDLTFAIQFLLLAVIPMFIGDPASIMLYLGFGVLSSSIFLLLTYIPVNHIFTLLTILFSSLYVGVFLMSILTVDIYAFVITFTAVGMFVRAWVRYRPPLWMPMN